MIYIYIYVYSHIVDYLLFSYFRNIITEFGLCDQIRVDGGREWALMLFVHQQLAYLRNNLQRKPYLVTTSKKVRGVCLCTCVCKHIYIYMYACESLIYVSNNRLQYCPDKEMTL